MKITNKIYTPPKYLTFIILVGTLIVAFSIFMIKEISILTIALSLSCILFLLAVLDLHFSKVIFNDSYIEIKNLFKKEKIKISDMVKVKIEDHELFLYLKNDKTKRLPSWFSDRHSLYKLLDSRLKASSHGIY
ncbi:hypothetical protein JCM12296A_17310 [Desulfosarcina cetonica]